jgi:hypothetical protein
LSNNAGTEENRSNKFKIPDQDDPIFSEHGSRLTETQDKEQSNLNQNSNQLRDSVAVFAREEETLPYDEANEKQLSETSIAGYPPLEQVRGLSQIFPDIELDFEGVFVKGMVNYIFGKGAQNVLSTGELKKFTECYKNLQAQNILPNKYLEWLAKFTQDKIYMYFKTFATAHQIYKKVLNPENKQSAKFWEKFEKD